MQLTISYGDNVLPLEISPDIELENLRVLVQMESQILPENQLLFVNGKMLLGDDKTITSLGVTDGDVILLTVKPASSAIVQPQQIQQRNSPMNTSGARPTGAPVMPAIDWTVVQIPGSSQTQTRQTAVNAPFSQSRNAAPSQSNTQNLDDPEVVRQMLLSNPHQLSLLKERNPRLAEALVNSNTEEFRRLFDEQRREMMERQRQRIQMLTANPFDPEIQRRIAEEIRMENVNANMATAMEHSPESFAQVFMLYIDCKVNGHHVKAFVDSGAQMTIMSKACAERCNITHLIDARWAGTAVGVGTQRILGRVHVCQIQIEEDYFPSSFSILEDQKMDMLLGLDMLKRHQCCIDLSKNALCIGTTNTQTSFLSEGDLPQCARQTQEGDGNATQEQEDGQLAKALAESSKDTS